MGTKFRVLPKCYGVYDFGGKEILCAEIEEICVTTESLPIEDYYECRSFALTEGLFYQDRILVEMYKFLENFEIKASDILPMLHNRRKDFSEQLVKLYSSFDNDTRTELWDSKEELKSFIKSDRTVIDRYYKGELGKNVLFRYRAIAALELVDAIHDEAFKIAQEVLKKKDPKIYTKYKEYILELKKFSTLRKRNVFDYEQKYEPTFNYDFKKLMENDFEGLPELLNESLKVTFFTSDVKKDMIREQIAERGSSVDGIGKILSRTLGSMLLRNVEFENKKYVETEKERLMKEIQVLEKDVGINQSPGEFI